MPRLQEIDVDAIIAGRYQPRTTFDKDALLELSQSIRENGMIQPMVVRPALNGKYEIVAGERRFKAACLAGYTKVPCLVGEYDNEKAAQVALIENIQREDLSVIEEAEAYQTLLAMTDLTQAQLAMRLGKTQSAIANKLRLLRLPESTKEALRSHQISERHARALLSLESDEEIEKMTGRIIKDRLTVRQTEERVKKKKPKGKTRVMTQNVRIALNTIRQAVKMVVQSGIDVEMKEEDGDQDYTIVLTIAKHKK